MEEIDISQLISYFKSKIIYIVFAISLAFCLSSIYANKFREPIFTSSTTILLNQANENQTISASDINLNNSLVTTYTEIIKSKKVLRQVIDNLSLDYEYEELSKMVSVGEVNDTSIIRISVENNDGSLAADIANSIAEVFAEEIVNIYNIENISIIDTAEIPESASSASTIKIILIASFLGGVIAIAIIFVVFYFDTTIKNEEEIEKATGLPVIGIIPINREKIKTSKHRKYYEDKMKKHDRDEGLVPVPKEIKRTEIKEEE